MICCAALAYYMYGNIRNNNNDNDNNKADGKTADYHKQLQRVAAEDVEGEAERDNQIEMSTSVVVGDAGNTAEV